jgi:hypothetical protein
MLFGYAHKSKCSGLKIFLVNKINRPKASAVKTPWVFGRSKRTVELCDSPLERGVGVCPLRFINTPLHPHFPARPLSRGELFIGKTNLPNSYDVFTAPLIICFLHYIEHIIKLE